jgi:hypothetical protein
MAQIEPGKRSQQLLEYWQSQPDLELCPPASEHEVRDFELRHSVSLANSMKELYQVANGFRPPGDQDHNGFSFWSLERIAPVDQYESGRFGNHKNLFLFADYLSWSWAYAVRLQPGTTDAVYMIGTASNNPLPVASSFDEFLHLYELDDARLYGS